MKKRSNWRRTGSVLGVGLGTALAAYVYKGVEFRKAAGKTLRMPDSPTPGSKEFARLIEALTNATLREGNRVCVMRNGHEIFPAMLEAIGAAEETINFSTYIWWSGPEAEKMGEALSVSARKGLEVRLLLDAWGSARIDKGVVAGMEEAGVQVEWFRPPKGFGWGKVNNRMHRRILVLDGHLAFAGGVGVAAEWEGNCETPELWRETHVRLEGPAVRDILGGFLENWIEAHGTVLTGKHLPALPPFDDGVPVLVIRSSGTAGITSVEDLFLAAISGAKARLWITTAYFAPAVRFIDALCEAGARGVDVRILVNGRPIDKEVVRKAGQHSYGRLLEAGVRIYEYEKARLHAKVIIVDDEWTNVGSANFDNRSFTLEDEINVSMHDVKTVATLAEHFLEDIESAREMTLEKWRSRPILNRLGELASELVRQSL